jgi:hypothetical protein
MLRTNARFSVIQQELLVIDLTGTVREVFDLV